MTIYTSYYQGEIRGEAISISLYPPQGWKGRHLPVFAPTPELLDWWKKSPKNESAQKEYERRFELILESRQTLIDIWLQKQFQSNVDITLCCYEKPEDFCHRHQIGKDIIQSRIPGKWGGEVAFAQSPDIGSTKELEPMPPVVAQLLQRCQEAGIAVKCDRIPCGYYQVFVDDKDLGAWGDLGILSVLSGLQSQFYRKRLLPQKKGKQASLRSQSEITSSSPRDGIEQTDRVELIQRVAKVKGEELTKIREWCNSVKRLMIPSSSTYADGRMELHLRHFVSLAGSKSNKKTEVKTVKASLYPGSEKIEEFGESLLPGFHQALVLFYPAGTQIKVHRDSPAYAGGAAQINVMGRARFSVSGCQDASILEPYWLEEGDCIQFDNKQPHGIDKVTGDRWCICFFKLKPEYLRQVQHEQLSLV